MTQFHQQNQQVRDQINVGGDYYAGARPRTVETTRLEAGLALLERLPVDGIPVVTGLPEGSRMMHQPNPFFVGREQELTALAHHLRGGTTVTVGQMAAATGLGGIGKSQLAAEFAHRYGRFFAGGVYWVSMADPASVASEVALCGRGMTEIGADYEGLGLAEQVQRVLGWWQSGLPRLLILDNCESPALLSQWQPRMGGCRVLVTSRRQVWSRARGMWVLGLPTLPRAESVALLLRFRPDLRKDCTQISQMNADSESWKSAESAYNFETEVEEALDGIAAALGDLPLALHLAGSYLESYRYSVSPREYLRALMRADLLAHRSLQGTHEGFSPTEHDLHVGRTFALSVERLDPKDEVDRLALGLLARVACFAPGERIPRALLLTSMRKKKKWKKKFKESKVESDGLGRLVELGLIEESVNHRVVMHRLVSHFVTGLAVDKAVRTDVEKVVHNYATASKERHSFCPVYEWQPHLQYVTDQAVPRRDKRAAYLCKDLGDLLNGFRAYAEAERYYQISLSIHKEVFGEVHVRTAHILNDLGMLLQKISNYREARPYLEQALSIRQMALRESHPDTADSLNNLGSLFSSMGEYEKALPYYEQSLSILREVLGESHPYTASSLNNLGGLFSSMGEYERALPYYEQSLSIRQEVLGENHPATAGSLNSLGILFSSMGEYERALPYFEQSLSTWQEILGKNHPGTADSLNNLGVLFKSIGEYEKALPYHEQSLSIRQEVLGENHPHTADSLNNLGILFSSMGEYERALPYFEQSLSIKQEVLGENHPDTARGLNNLGAVLDNMGEYEETKGYYEKALSIWQEVLGKNHPHTASSLNNLGSLFSSMGEYEKALPYLEQSLSIRQEVLGKNHPHTAGSLNSLGILFSSTKEYEEAASYLEEALMIRETMLGASHPDTQETRLRLENVREEAKKLINQPYNFGNSQKIV